MNESTETLGQKLGMTKRHSMVLDKAEMLGLNLPQDLQRLAVARGSHYYIVNEAPLPSPNLPLSNAELAVALLSPALPPTPQDIRIAAAVLSAPDVDVSILADLAEKEGCAGLVRYIAECGRKYEPDSLFWQNLIARLRDAEIPSGSLPHPTRFIEMTGMIRGKVGFFTHWIRPIPAMA